MCGAVYLTSYCPDLADFFHIGKEILCYASFHDCREQIERILSDEAEAERIRAAALGRCLREHTWQTRILEGLALLRGDEAA
jgi:spore maturation protein CgeB